MVEAVEEPQPVADEQQPEDVVNPRSEVAILNLATVDQASALGLFRQAELTTQVDVIMANYTYEALKVAQVSIRRAAKRCDFAAEIVSNSLLHITLE